MNNSNCLDTHALLTHTRISTRRLYSHLTMLLLVLLLLKIYPNTGYELVEAKCHDLPKLGVLPGQGWDALTSKDKSKVIELTYNECKMTSDGKYLIPDGTEAILIKTKDMQVNSELLEHWSNYTTITAKGFKVGIGFWPTEYLALYASYSEDYKQIKWLQVKYRAVATRIQLRNSLYHIRAEPDASLTPALRKQFLEVIRAVGRNHTDKALYLLQLIVRDYGTHYSKSVDAGAIFVKEDFLKTSFVRNHEKEETKILSSSKVSFFELIDLSWQNKQELDGSFVNEYKNAVVDKRSRAIGGPNWVLGMSANEWLAGTSENMVAIDRSGDLLSSLITPTRFPNAPHMVLRNVYEMLGKTIQDYYKFNIHGGCTQPTSPNFDYSANLEDGSCEALVNDHSFGGVYQTCDQSYYTDKHDACSRFIRKNELTGDVTCPTNFVSTLLYSQSTGYQFYFNYPWQECSGIWWWKKCWYNDNHQKHTGNIIVSSYICMATSSSSLKETSYLFGGLYSPEVVNVHTKSNNCPSKFRSVQLFYDGRLTICIRNNRDASLHYALSFGGLTSCKTKLRCPSGYHGRLATILEGCQINYCLHSSTPDLNLAEPLLVQPPFINGTGIFQPISADDEVDYDEYGMPQRIVSEEVENRVNVGILASFCLMFLCALVCFVYWQRNRLFFICTKC
uniref:MACPF domain-containing protein n=1 Tax=Strigamia maritima TaxID=126957 RepID=T1IZ34_STRMM